MLEKIFLQILNMSFIASFVILFVLIARLLLRKSPKILSYALWSVVLFRLICPFSFESVFSLLPAKTNPISQDIIYAAIPTIDTGIPAINNSVNQLLPAVTPAASVNPLQIWVFIGSAVWLMGIAILLIYSISSLLKLQKRLKNAVHEKDNIYLAKHLDTPFVMGIIHPKIYLPASLKKEEKRYILLHEQMHIRRFDHVIKIVSFFVLCLHWFNPFVWVAFFVSSRDMEMSCDEAVIKELGSDVKKEYSSSLLTLATGRHIIGGSPLAFGEGDTKGRIKNVLNYKKPAFWMVAVAVVVCVVLAVCLIGNPPDTSAVMSELFSYSVSDIEKIEFQNGNTGELVAYTDEAEINDIIDHLNAFQYDQIDPVVSSGWTYAVRLWFKDGSDMQRITLTPSSASINGNHYISSEHEYFPQEWMEEYCLIQEDAEAVPAQQGGLTFFVKPDEPPQVIGETAAIIWLKSYMEESTPPVERIEDYDINEVTVISGTPKAGQNREDMNYHYVVRMNYDITTASDEYFAPGDGVSGRGTFKGLFRELCVKDLGGGNFDIISAGTGGGESEFS